MRSDRPLFLHAPLPPEYRLRLETLLVEQGVEYGYDTEWAKSEIVQADLPPDARVIADLIDSILESVFDVTDESSINVTSFETD